MSASCKGAYGTETLRQGRLPIWPLANDFAYTYFSPTAPVVRSDPSGSLSIFGSCLWGGGWTGFVEILRHLAFGSGSCSASAGKAPGACIAATLGAILGGLFGLGLLSGCVAGLVAAIASDVASRLCDQFIPTKSCYPNATPVICDVISIAVGTIAGCIGGYVNGEQIFDSLVSALGVLGQQFGLDACTYGKS